MTKNIAMPPPEKSSSLFIKQLIEPQFANADKFVVDKDYLDQHAPPGFVAIPETMTVFSSHDKLFVSCLLRELMS